MADFCRDCSIAMFGEDTKDLAKLMREESYTSERGAIALCECCGPIVVDFEGKRMSSFAEHCKCAEPYATAGDLTN